MNTRKLIKTVVLVAAGLLVSKIISCDLKDDDFSDIQIIQQIIKEDVEDIYGVEKAGDDSLFVTASLAKSLAGSGNSGYGFQRRVTKVERKIDVTIIADTLAEARIEYDVSGTFRVDSNFTTLAGKKFRHRLERYVGFVKRPDTDSLTRRTWRPTGFTPAFGASLNDMGEYRTAMEFDSLLIVTPDFQYEVNDPGDLFTFYRNPIRVKRGDHVSVRIKAINAFDVLDIPVGFLKSGRNRDQFSRKFQFQRIPGTFTYEYQFTVDNGQLRGFNQLVLDFITASTIIRRNKPYDSRLIMISYRVTD